MASKRNSLPSRAREELAIRKLGRILIAAIRAGNSEDEVRRLIRAGARVNQRNETRGKTPLVLAAELGRVKIARILIDNGAPVNKPSEDGFYRTPLYYAVMMAGLYRCNQHAFCRDCSHVGMVKLLLERGATLNTSYGAEAPLLVALNKAWMSDGFKVMELLLAGGADANVSSMLDFGGFHLGSRNPPPKKTPLERTISRGDYTHLLSAQRRLKLRRFWFEDTVRLLVRAGGRVADAQSQRDMVEIARSPLNRPFTQLDRDMLNAVKERIQARAGHDTVFLDHTGVVSQIGASGWTY